MSLQQKRDELYHHGIVGQKWGVKHGPPYPLEGKVSSKVQKAGKKKKDEEYQKKREKLKKSGKGKTEKGYDPNTRGFDDYLEANRRERQREYDAVNSALDRIKQRQMQRAKEYAYNSQMDNQIERILSQSSDRLNRRYADDIADYHNRHKSNNPYDNPAFSNLFKSR